MLRFCLPGSVGSAEGQGPSAVAWSPPGVCHHPAGAGGICLHSQQKFHCGFHTADRGAASPPLLLPPYLPYQNSFLPRAWCAGALLPQGTGEMSLSLQLLRAAAALQLLWANTPQANSTCSQRLGQLLKMIVFLPLCTCGHPQSAHPQLSFLRCLPNSPWLKGEDLGVFQGQFSAAAVDVFRAGAEDQAQRK